MTESSSPTQQVLAQADALMRRHRTFVAGATPVSPPISADNEEEIPVLTDIIDDKATVTVPISPDVDPVANAIAEKHQLIETILEQWLDKELPNEVLRVMDGVSDQLIGTLVRRMREELLPQLVEAPAVNHAPNDTSGQPLANSKPNTS